jgi:hypothetical protein
MGPAASGRPTPSAWGLSARYPSPCGAGRQPAGSSGTLRGVWGGNRTGDRTV